jgi:hypothetical protein
MKCLLGLRATLALQELLKQAGKTVDRAQRRTQVMGQDMGEGVGLFAATLQLRNALLETGDLGAQLRLPCEQVLCDRARFLVGFRILPRVAAPDRSLMHAGIVVGRG